MATGIGKQVLANIAEGERELAIGAPLVTLDEVLIHAGTDPVKAGGDLLAATTGHGHCGGWYIEYGQYVCLVHEDPFGVVTS